MKYIFITPSLTKPTSETLEEHSKKMFQKIERFLNQHEEYTLRISGSREGEDFVVVAELHPDQLVITEKNRDLRIAISKAAQQLKTKIRKDKEKRTNNSHSFKAKVQAYIDKVTERF